MKNIVYEIRNKKNGKFYIGSTEAPESRLRVHLDVIGNVVNQKNELHNDIKIYGKESFTTIIIKETYDKIEASRLESALIRENKDNHLCYNISQGASGRRVFYDSEIEFIRILYGECKMIGSEVYEKYFKDKVTERAFSKVWNGGTFKNICYDVYTNENKLWHSSKSRSLAGEKNGMAIITEEDVIFIRTQKKNGKSRFEVYDLYKDRLTRGSFECVWYNQNWKHVKI